jgi:hypothetical protein
MISLKSLPIKRWLSGHGIGWQYSRDGTRAPLKRMLSKTRKLFKRPRPDDLTDFLNQRMRDYCIGMISSRWRAKGANVCGAGGL